MRLGVDFYHNERTYSSTDPNPFTAAHFDEVDDHAFVIRLGYTTRPRGWEGGYTYAKVEALALNSSYAGEDWVRWGGVGQARPTDLVGHEIRLAHRVSERTLVVARIFKVEAISTAENGNRFRLDVHVVL
ncbi:hypothetical protein IIA16_01990 [bacterium]|nr:hypothetical protein [bacterium]